MILHSFGRRGILLLALLAPTALAQIHNEIPDAGNLAGQGPAQFAGPVSEINGVLEDYDTDEDCYTVTLLDPINTTLEVTQMFPLFNENSQLFLFDANIIGGASGLFMDDDDGVRLLSKITAADMQAAGIVAPGDYEVCISGFDNDPFNFSGFNIFPGPGLPNPAGGGNVVASWSDTPGSDPAEYQITITVGGPNAVTETNAGDLINEPAQDACKQPVDQITGTLSNAQDDEDCYCITVESPADFSAEVVAFGLNGDSQLFLFDENRNGIAWDDDGGGGLRSLIPAADFARGGGMRGDYLLCITAFDNDPINAAGGDIFADPSVPTPTPTTGNAIVGSWNDGGDPVGSTTYDIRLTGIDAIAPNVNLQARTADPLRVTGATSITFENVITNKSGSTVSGDLWAVAQNASGTQVFTTPCSIQSGTLVDGQVATVVFTQFVPGGVTPGTYAYTIKIGVCPNLVIDSETFTVIVEGPSPADRETGDWAITEVSPWQVTEPVRATTADAQRVTAYPNPFATETRIAFTLDAETPVRLTVYDLLGREVVRLVDGTVEAGSHRVPFEAGSLPSGTYLYRLEAGEQMQRGRLTLIR